MQITTTYRGRTVTITDIAPIIAEQQRLEEALGVIMRSFDPNRPALLRAREREIVRLHNEIVENADIVQRWREAEEAALAPVRDANVMAVWTAWRRWQAVDAAYAERRRSGDHPDDAESAR
ncbi:MAG: hypothetical protein PGN23_07290 [Sphingomonas adhaesiva]|uniref:hypothetical protein n=1 Tax=Sphingomonas adhaesiva TaxID=28212 RepID=UPI002FFCC816